MNHWLKRLLRLLPMTLAVCLLWDNSCFAQQKGLIIGKVLDDEQNSPLPGATVQVANSPRGAATNLSGQFEIGLESGEYDLKISYLGYEDTTLHIDVKPQQTTSATVALKSKTLRSGEIVVTGQMEGQAKALNQQRTASTILNVVSADQISRFPDPNVAEALQRVPGLNVERDEGEGRYVLVRGLAPQFTNININGEQIPSAESGIRYLALDAIPADQLASMEITKTLTPDMDGDAIAGSVNLITRKATQKEFTVSGSLAGEYNDLMAKGGGQSSLQFSQRLGDDGKFGYLVNANYYMSQRGSDKVEPTAYDFDSKTPALTELELRDYEIDRNRLGLSTTLDYQLNDNTQFYLRGIYSQLYEHEWRRRVIFLAEDNEIRREIKDRAEDQGVLSFNLGARHVLPSLNLDYEASYSRANQDTPDDKQLRFTLEDVDIDFNTSNPLKPIATVKSEGNSVNVNDYSLYKFNRYETSGTTQLDENYTAKINAELPFSLGDQKAFLKFGAKVRLKEKSFKLDYFNDYRGDSDDIPNLDAFTGGIVDDDFLNGDYKPGKFPDNGKFEDYLDANSNKFENKGDLEEEAAVTDYTARENVYAGYVQAKTQFGKLMVLGGVRYEYTDVDYESSYLDEDLGKVDISGKNNYSYILPMIHLRYQLTPYTNLRSAMTFSYARPNFDDIFSTERGVNLNEGEAKIPNYNLEPVSAFNLDIFAEHYLGNVGIISAGVFYKRLDKFIYTKAYTATFQGIDDVEITQAVNGEQADLVGFEIAWQQNLDFLPGFLSGLGIYANYTYTWSEATVTNRAEADKEKEKIRLPGQAKHVGNVALSYTLGGFSGRVSANFNGNFISALGSNSKQDYYVDDRLQFDVSLSYAITPQISVFSEFINLTNERRVDYIGSLDTPVTRELYGFWAR
ncbi:MAG: TonB-dependent receptor, partial [Chlorobiales bacterium]|nr:TonB-dependent receptor [Chlorobiales bacterium]